MVLLVKNWQFFLLFILRQIAQANVFHDILERKTPFYTKNTRTSKQHKTLRFFQKGLVHGFGQKLAIFPSFYHRQNRAGKCVPRYFKKKKRLSRPLKQKLEIFEKLGFFQRGQSMVLVKIGNLSIFFILGGKSQKNVFYGIVERKSDLLDYKKQ